MSWDIYGNPLRRGYCEVHPDVHQEYPCSICMAGNQQHSQPYDELEQLKYDFAQQGDYIRKLEADINGFGQKLRSAQHEVESLQLKAADRDKLQDELIDMMNQRDAIVALVEAAEKQLKDTQRLDFLDQINAEFNKRMGSSYGWAIDWNHNRIALHDMDPMRMTVRQAIDAKMQEVLNKADS